MCFNNIEKDIEYCGKYGFEAIELKYSLIHNLDMTWLKGLMQSSRVLAGSIGAIQLPVMQAEEIRQGAEKKLRDICECANELQAEYVVAIPSRDRGYRNWSLVEEDALKILKSFAETAKTYNVNIALEVTGFADSAINTLEKGLRLIHMAEKDNLGMVYDLYHVLGMGELEQKSIILAQKDLFIVHINDGMKCNIEVYRDDERLWPGDGDIDIGEQVTRLQRIGYKGPFSMEVYQSQPWFCDIRECYRTARIRMKKIEQLAYVKLMQGGRQYDSGLE